MFLFLFLIVVFSTLLMLTTMSIALACLFILVVKCSVCIIIQLQNGHNNLTPFDKRLKKVCTSENLSAGVQCMHFQLKQERMDLQFE